MDDKKAKTKLTQLFIYEYNFLITHIKSAQTCLAANRQATRI